MSPEQERTFEPKVDFQNMEVIDRILVSGSPFDRKALQKFHNLTNEKMEHLVYYARLRDHVHRESEKAVEQRRLSNPQATQEELDMGVYMETIEQQVRAALVEMRQKGYSTFESGFYSTGESQRVGFMDNPLSTYKLPSVLKNDERIVTWDIQPDSITFFPRNHTDLNELTILWNMIAQSLPDKGWPTKPSSLPGAVSFRKKQEQYQKVTP